MNVLVLSSSDKVFSAAVQLLALCGGHRALRACDVMQARTLIGQREFGAAVIYGDGPAAELRDICLTLAENCVGTAFLPRGGEVPGELYDSGVIVAERPLTKAALYVALRAALGIAYGYERLRRENADLKRRLEILKTVSRAKCVLASRGMTEEEAHAEIEHRAMNERRSKTDIAKEIIEGNDVNEKDK